MIRAFLIRRITCGLGPTATWSASCATVRAPRNFWRKLLLVKLFERAPAPHPLFKNGTEGQRIEGHATGSRGLAFQHRLGLNGFIRGRRRFGLPLGKVAVRPEFFITLLQALW